jgi:signal transduction histidine kinase
MDLNDSNYFQIFERLDIGILLLHLPTRKILSINRYAQELIEITSWDKLIAAVETDNSVIQQKRKIRSKIRIGQVIIGYTIYYVMENHVAVLLSDISEKERLREMAEATAMMDNVAYILAGFSHEVGNPLNSIKTLASVLRENIENFPSEKVVEYLGNILSEVGRIEFLLRMFKVFRSYEDLDVQLIDIRVFFERFSKLLERDLRARNIEFRVDYHHNVLYAVGDERALQQIMLNVLTNAMDAVSESENPFIQVDISNSERNVEITVTDNGIGISPKESDKLFLPFYTTKAKGTGMGLTIVKNLLTRMGGSIKIGPMEKGTRVSVLIPNSI